MDYPKRISIQRMIIGRIQGLFHMPMAMLRSLRSRATDTLRVQFGSLN